MSKRICEDTRRRDLTFSQLLQRVVTDEALPKKRKHYAATSIRSFIRLTGADPENEWATFSNCRALTQDFSPVAHEITPEYWTTIRCGVAFAVRRFAAGGWSERLPQVSRGWRDLIRNANEDRAVTHGLSRFMRFCTVIGAGPSRVTNDVVARYRVYLIDHSLVGMPHTVYRRTIHNWNWAVGNVPGWPKRKLRVPTREAYTLPRQSFPSSFRADCDRWKRCVVNAHPLDPRAPRAAITNQTADRRLRYLRAFASGIVREGVPSTQIRSLADLAKPENFRKGVRFFWNRAGKKPSPFQREAYSVVRYMSQYWVKADPTVISMMAKAATRCRRSSQGITPKDLSILQQFDDPSAREKLFALPKLLVGLARNMTNPKLAALTVQRALATEILLVAPMRLKNLCSLRLDRHVVATGPRGRRGVRLVIPREEVKNILRLDFPLPPETVELLELYVRRYRPILIGKWRTKALFPGNADGHVQITVLSNAITRLIQRYAGLFIHVHAFRHLAAKLFLERYPHRYDLLSLLLGHRSIETTRKFYCALEMAAISRQYSSDVIRRAKADHLDLQPFTPPQQDNQPILQASRLGVCSFGRPLIQLHSANTRRMAT